MSIKVIIDPVVNVYYASFHIQGLIQKFGKKNIVFKAPPFENVINRHYNFNFIVSRNGIETKYSIHLDDPYRVDKDSYAWCDVYGNVNANFEKTPIEFHTKLVSLSPSFGIRLWNLPNTIYYAFTNYIKVRESVDSRKFFGKYKRQFKLRLPLSQYHNSIATEFNSKYYIFHLSTLWYDNEWNNNDDGVNKTRANFIVACKSIGEIIFEGGLAINNERKIKPMFEPLIFHGTISIQKYLEKIKQSVLVFNTPAFWDCHGWKLGEYLALGKAIISTPLSNDLPFPLEHGVNIHIVENDIEEFKKAILLISENISYRHKLEKGALDYWEKYGTPIKSLELLGI